MVGQQSLSNFYRSVYFSHPILANEMNCDLETVALHALSNTQEEAKPAAERLRRMAFDLPEIHRRVLDNALTDLGYSR
jgi:hypothetical protein